MSLDDCIKYAIENSEQLEIAGLENSISETRVKEALAGGYPQIDGSLTLTKNFDIQQAFINDMPIPLGTKYAGIAGLTARQLIFDGSFFVGLEAARTVRELSSREEDQEKVNVIENVSKAYYLVLVSVENLDFAARNFATLDTLLRETTALYESGFAEKIEVSRLKVQHNNIETELQNNTDLLITSYNLLKFQMGMPVTQKIALTDKLSDGLISSIDESEDYSFVNRPEYLVLETNKQLAELSIKNFKSQYIPDIYADAALGWNSGTNSFGDMTNFNGETWFRYSNLGATISIPVFDGFEKRSNLQRNKIQRDQIQLRIDQLANNVNREVMEAKVNLENAKRNIKTQKENVALAQEVCDVTRIKYREGVGSNFEVVEANTDLKEAQTNYLNAVYEGITSQIEFKKALGILNK